MKKRVNKSKMPKRPRRTIVGAEAERVHQQEQLEKQAVELELQAVALQQQVEELARANSALLAAEVATARAHRQAMDELHERLRQAGFLDAAMHTVPIALSIVDCDLRYIKVNASTAALTGLEVGAHVGRTLREVNPQLSPVIEAAMRHVVATGEPCHGLRLARPTPHAKGGVVEIEMHITAFHDDAGNIAGACCTATDLTEWKSLQEQFFHAQRLEAVGQLAAGIAHDFNNLLTIVGSCCDLVLMEMSDTAPHREDIEEIRNAAIRATTLARRMLGTASHRVLVARPFELRSVVLDARDMMEHAVRTRAQLQLDCSDDPGVVSADPSQVEQVLLNLVINAVDALPDGGVVSVRTRAVSLPAPLVTRGGQIPAGPYAELTVSDTGTGMDARTLARIFEPFFTTKAPGKGTGLGLATVFAIVRDLGGGVDVTSAEGAGTRFRILLPRVTTEEATGPRTARFAAAAALPRGTETVLLVEDEDVLRASVARVFTRHGYRVLQARHGGEALRMIGSEADVALVVSDLHMPGVDGHELSTRLRALGRSMPVLFMSGSSGTEAATAAPGVTVEGRDRFIAKPFAVETLLTTVREMLEG